MKRFIPVILISIFSFLTLLGVSCPPTLLQIPAPTNTSTPNTTPVPTNTPFHIPLRITSYQDSSGTDPVADGYINMEEKENGFKIIGEVTPGDEVKVRLKFKDISETSIGSVYADTEGNWEIDVTSDKWGADGHYTIIVTSSSGETLTQEVLLDTVPPSIVMSGGYTKSIMAYSLEITQDADPITVEVSDPGALVTAVWEVYVKVGSGIVISRNGNAIGAFQFDQGDYTKISAVPGVIIKVKNELSEDARLEFETEAPTWGDGYFLIQFSEDIKTSSIPALSSGIGTETGCRIMLSSYGDNYGVVTVVGNAQAIFPRPGTASASLVRYLAPSGVLDNKTGWHYVVSIEGVEDLAGNKEDLETGGDMEEYEIWLR